MKRLIKALRTMFLAIFIGVFAFGLTSCASSAEIATSYDYSVTSCVYDADNDRTKVTWYSTIYNDSIYEMREESFKFDLYKDGEFVRTTKYITWEFVIRPGESYSSNRWFYATGVVTDAKINVWSAEFANVWDTYTPWFIATIVVAALLGAVYIVAMIINDLDFSDVIEFVGDHFYILFAFGLPLLGYLRYGFWNWLPPLIISGGFVSVILVMLIAHGIKHLVDCDFRLFDFFGDGKPIKKYDSKDKPFLTIEGTKRHFYIKDLVGDSKSLGFFSKQELKDYCLEKGYVEAEFYNSKTKLINCVIANAMIEEDNKENEETAETEKKQKSKKTAKKRVAKTTFEDIAGLDEAKKAFNEKVIMPFQHPEIFEKYGKKTGGGILLYGLPGTGKTMFAEAAANEIDALFIPIKCSDIKSKWYGESERNVKKIFDKARKAEKAIIFFDEFEAIGAKRTDGESANNDLVPQILAEMQGVGSSSTNSAIVVIAATNKPWAIDSAFLRPGRFDEKIYIPLPDLTARKKLFELQLKKSPTSKDMDFDYLAKISDGFNGADIKEFCEKLKMSAINDSLEKGVERPIDMSDVEKVEATMKSSVSAEDIERLQEFENN